MVQVPRFTSVESQPIRAVPMGDQTVSPMPDTMSEQAQAVTKAGMALGQGATRAAYYMEKQQEMQARQTMQRDIATIKQKDNVFGDVIRDEYARFSQLKGQEADQRKQEFMDRISEQRRKLFDELGNETQRAAFTDAADARMRGIQFDFDQHAQKQLDHWTLAESMARQEGFIMDAPNKVELVMVDGKTTVRERPDFFVAMKSALRENDEWQRQTGLGPKARKMRDLDVTSKIHGRVMANLLETKDERAMQAAVEYYDRNEEQIDPKLRPQMREIRNTVNDQIVARTTIQNKEFIGKNLDEQIVLVREKMDRGELTQKQAMMVESEFRSNNLKVREENAAYARNVIDSAAAWLQTNGSNSMTFMPSNLAAELSKPLPPELAGAIQRTNVSDILVGYSAQYGWQNSAEAQQIMNNTSPQMLANMSENELYIRYRGKLNDSNLNYLMALRRQYVGQGTTEDINKTTQREMFRQSAARSGRISFINGKVTEADSQKYTDLWLSVEDQISFYKKNALENRRDLNREEIQSQIDAVLKATVSEEGTFWGYNKGHFRYGQTPEEMANDAVQLQLADGSTSEVILMSQIPADDLAFIRRSIANDNMKARAGYPMYREYDDVPEVWAYRYMQLKGLGSKFKNPMGDN